MRFTIMLMGFSSSDDGVGRPWRADNPLAVPTERERHAVDQQLPVYRVLYRRNRNPVPDLSRLESRWREIDNPGESCSL